MVSSNDANTVSGELNAYYELLNEEVTEDCQKFWYNRRKRLRRLYEVVRRILSIPASSAPVERVFSHGGIFIRPHRARLGAKMLSSLTYLKCNRHLT